MCDAVLAEVNYELSKAMIRDEIIDWLVFAVMGCTALVMAALVVGMVHEVSAKSGRNAAEAERRERVEWACWCDEWADTRAAQEKYLLERRGR